MKDGQQEWLQLDWEAPVDVREIQITFNDDVNEDLINLHHHKTPFEIIPELVKNYRVEALIEGVWKPLVSETDNRKRTRNHRFDPQIRTGHLRVVVESTNGGACAEIVGIRVY